MFFFLSHSHSISFTNQEKKSIHAFFQRLLFKNYLSQFIKKLMFLIEFHNRIYLTKREREKKIQIE